MLLCLQPSSCSPDITGSVATICSALPWWGCAWCIMTLPRNSRDPAVNAMQTAMMTDLHLSARCLRGFGAMPAGYRSNLTMSTRFPWRRQCCKGHTGGRDYHTCIESTSADSTKAFNPGSMMMQFQVWQDKATNPTILRSRVHGRNPRHSGHTAYSMAMCWTDTTRMNLSCDICSRVAPFVFQMVHMGLA